MTKLKQYDVVALGELLIDFTQNGISQQGNIMYEANPGGAPCNVLAMLNNLNRKTAFIGKVGNDQFGLLLKQTLDELGIGTQNLLFDNEVRTTLAFVHTSSDGDRAFSFYRNPGADMMLSENEIDEALLMSTKVFHFGTLSMTHGGVRKATKRALDIAIASGAIISFDPNLREPLWDSMDDAREQVHYGLGRCNVLKISDDELEWFAKEKDIALSVNQLQEQYKIPLILVTMGKYGSRAYYKNLMVEAEAFIQNSTIETTGAGDTFCACIIDYILKNGLDNLSEKQLYEMLRFANASSSIITTKKGALKVMPQKKEVLNFIDKHIC